jgi:hypothetical protein
MQTKCLRIASISPWYVGKRRIHKDLRIPFFADDIRALIESFRSKLTDAGNQLARQPVNHCADRGLTEVPTGSRDVLLLGRPDEAVPQKRAKSVQRVVLLMFSVLFLKCKKNPGYNSKWARLAFPNYAVLQSK